MNNTTDLINSPFVVMLFSVAATALIGLAVAAMRMVVQLARMSTELIEIRQTLTEIKTDPDVMRWSNYGRATQALQPHNPNTGMQP